MGEGWTIGNRLPQARAAGEYAARMHAGQYRGDGTPFILHPSEVASLLDDAGAPDHLVAAGVLHDVLEKTDTTADDLRLRFGARVTRLVLAVSDDERITRYSARKAALRAHVAREGDEALLLFAADKLSKVRELRREASRSPTIAGTARQLRVRRLNHYRRSLAVLEERLPGNPLVVALHEELGALMRDRAAVA
ncbi:MAG TPA: HD domain-containing protein [Solirubrobacteraceae bacterium]|nr:HD domain-containing protein [Solirubrobacteraceae bacterium]